MKVTFTTKKEMEFCKIYTSYHGEVINNVKQFRQTFTGEELMEFSDFYAEQKCQLLKDQHNKELKEIREEIVNLPPIHLRGYDLGIKSCILEIIDKHIK